MLANFERSRLELKLIELSVSVEGQQQSIQPITDDDSLLANFLDLRQLQQAGKALELELFMIPMLANLTSTQPSHHVASNIECIPLPSSTVWITPGN